MWAHNGRELFFKSGGQLMVVEVDASSTFRTGEIRPLFSLDGMVSSVFHQTYAVAPDDERFLMIRVREVTRELVLVRNFLREIEERVGN